MKLYHVMFSEPSSTYWVYAENALEAGVKVANRYPDLVPNQVVTINEVADNIHKFVVYIQADSDSAAARVMDERLGFDEDYGFPYKIKNYYRSEDDL